MGLFRRSRPTMHSSRPSRSLTASGERVSAKRAADLNRLNTTWQKRSFAYYDDLGEVKYASTFFARLARLELFAGEWVENADGERELIPTDNDQAIQALDRIKDPGGSGGRSTMLGTYGRLKFLAGECYLFFTERDGEEHWEILSTSELRPNPLGTGGYQRIRAPSLSPEEYKDPGEDEWENVDANQALAWRLWRRHPQYSEWPDAPMRGVLELCEQLLMLDRSVRSRSLSRLAGNGILFVDDRISPPPPTPAPDEDPAEDQFIDDLTATMVEPMSDEAAAEHVVPLVVRVPVPLEGNVSLKDMIHHMKLTEPGELYPETGLRDEVLRRIAIGLEMPAEFLTGIGDTSHWNAWAISDEGWEHLEPFAQELVDDLTAAYYLPTLKSAGLDDWANFAIGYDEAALRTEPEQVKDGKDLHAAGAIGDAALRRVAGFNEDDAQTDEERRVWLSIKSRDPGFALGDDPVGSTATTPAGGPGEPGVTTGRPDGSRSETEKQPPDQAESDVPGTVAGAAMREAQVLAAFELGVARAREVASNRVKSKAKGNDALVALLEGTNGVYAPALLGQEHTAVLGTPTALVGGARNLLVAPLRRWGLTSSQTDLILKAMEAYTVQTFYFADVPPIPPQLRNYVVDVIRNG